MRTYRCICENRLFFENSVCTSCGREVAWCEVCGQIVPLLATDENPICGNAQCGARLEKCANYATYGVCNRCLAAAAPDEAKLCRSCRLTRVIPDLSVAGNLEKWADLEAAKRRLLFELDALQLPYDAAGGAVRPLSFRFEASTDEKQVNTGHADGVVTVNIDEADSVAREVARQQFQERHRTLIGHFRHEASHYVYLTLVAGSRMEEFVQHFGDPQLPPYPEALARYHQTGPPPDWRERFISAYAAAHPWEDFAETFAFYLDMRSVLATAEHHLPGFFPVDERGRLASLCQTYGRLGVIANELNRTMGLADLLPEVVPPRVLPKLHFCHALVQRDSLHSPET